jgi:4'-phosphopantetheinyl transferase
MSALPPAMWKTGWGCHEIAVFASGDDAAISLEDASALLSDDERMRAAKFHFSRDRDRWMRSRALLRLCLADRLDVSATSLAFEPGPNGKPSLPAWPDCHFNLSHSGNFTAIVTGPEPAGIDIESPGRQIDPVALAAHVFPPGEVAALAANSSPHRLFYQLWTVREAVMKCTGLGMSLPPAVIAVRCGADGVPDGAVRTDDGTEFEILSGTSDGYVVAAARRRQS